MSDGRKVRLRHLIEAQISGQPLDRFEPPSVALDRRCNVTFLPAREKRTSEFVVDTEGINTQLGLNDHFNSFYAPNLQPIFTRTCGQKVASVISCISSYSMGNV